MGVVESSKGMLKPVSDNLINETQIVCRLAMATLGNRSAVNWHHYAGSYDAIRDAIEKSIPGFEHYNVRVRRKVVFYLPNAPIDGRFNTKKYGDHAPFTLTTSTDNVLAPDEYIMETVP